MMFKNNLRPYDYRQKDGITNGATVQVDTSNLVTKSELSTIGNMSPKGAYATLTALQSAFPTGTSGVYTVAADNKWYYYSGSSWTAGGDYSANTKNMTTLFDFHKRVDGWHYLTRGTDFTFTEGLALKSADGTATTSGSFNASNIGVSDYIDVTGYSHVSCMVLRSYGLAIASVAFYLADNTFISSYIEGNSVSATYKLITIPSNAVKMKYAYYTNAQATTVSAPALTTIGLYASNAISNIQSGIQTDLTTLQNRYVRTDALFNKTIVTNGKGITAGGIIDDATKFLSDFIPITNASTLYVINGSGAVNVRFYDSNKTFIKYATLNFSNQAILISNTTGLESAAYLQFSDLLTKIDAIYLSTTPIIKRKPLYQLPYNTIDTFSNLAINWWEGKNGDALGDSLTGAGLYQKYVKGYFNLLKYSNHGIGGTKLSGAANGNGDSMWMDSRINSLDMDADFITVLGGQNDGSVTIGTLSIDNRDTSTYAGALNVLISKILYKYQKLSSGRYTDITYSGITQLTTAKNIIIFLCTPFYVPSEEASPAGRQDKASAVREIAKLWALPVIDLAANSQLHSGVADVYWATDRVHPIESAYSERLAPVFIGAMERFKPVDYTKAHYV